MKTTGTTPAAITSVVVPPLVPAKPPKPSAAAPSVTESGKAPSLESKYESPVVTQKLGSLTKPTPDNHSKCKVFELSLSCGLLSIWSGFLFSAEAYGTEKSTTAVASAATAADKDKPNIYRKPMVPLVGMAKPKFNPGGRLLTGSGANSPNSDEKAEVDGKQALAIP